MPTSCCWVPRWADVDDGLLPPAAMGTVSKTENQQPVSWSYDSSPLLERRCPPRVSRGLSPGRDIGFSLLKGIMVQQAPALTSVTLS